MHNPSNHPDIARRAMNRTDWEVPLKRYVVAAVLMATCMLVGSVAEAKANRGQGVTLEFYALTTHATFELTDPPQPGQRAIFARDLYMLGGTPENPQPVGDPVGRNSIICTLVSMIEASCEGRWDLDGLGVISGVAFLDRSLSEAERPAAPLTGGTGIFIGARGEIRTFSVPDSEDQVWIIEILGRSGR